MLRPQPCASEWVRCRCPLVLQALAGVAARAIAQMKPAISRAMAVMTTTLAFPAATRWRYRWHILSCPFQAMSRTACGNDSSRARSLGLTRACMR